MVTYHNPESQAIRTEPISHQLADIFAIEAPAWMDQALCAQTDPALFFPDSGVNPNQAKRICAQCPVQTTCLAYALEANLYGGVWGGLTQHERERVRTTKPCRHCGSPVPRGNQHACFCSEDCATAHRAEYRAAYDRRRRGKGNGGGVAA